MNRPTKRILTVGLLLLLLASAVVCGACGKESALTEESVQTESVQQTSSDSAESALQESSDFAESAPQTSSESSEGNTVVAPDFMVLDKNGNEVHLSDYKGKPVVLNFWATWCGYCKKEMPDFDTAYAKYPDVQFLMVNATDGVYETVETATAYVESEGFSFDVFFDVNMETVSLYGVTAFPTTIFIDKDGNAVAMQSGMLTLEVLEIGIAMIAE